MNIEKLGRKAINKIKDEWGLPEKGVLAGGALSNLIWEMVTGNKAVINDIDIFLKTEDFNEESWFKYCEEKNIQKESSYGGIFYKTEEKEIYKIKNARRKGIFNFIEYYSITDSFEIIPKSFDLNCTKISYSIDEDKFFWTKDFESFLESGQVKISNLTTPAHTAIRMAKKEKDLNVKIDDLEFSLCQKAIIYRYIDIVRIRFKKGYKISYENNYKRLNNFFKLSKDIAFTQYIKERYGSSDDLYELKPNSVFNISDFEFGSTKQLLFYTRNIYGNDEKVKIYNKLSVFFKRKDYLDIKYNNEQINFLSFIRKEIKNSSNNLSKYKMSEQIKLLNEVLKYYKDDFIMSYLMIDRLNLNLDSLDEETNRLVLELSLRKPYSLESSISKHRVSSKNKMKKIVKYYENNKEKINEFVF